MACVCLEKNGKYSIEFRINGKRTRKKGFTNKKIAQRIADKIEELITAKKIGTMSEELKLWKAELEKNAPETYDWLETLDCYRSVKNNLQLQMWRNCGKNPGKD